MKHYFLSELKKYRHRFLFSTLILGVAIQLLWVAWAMNNFLFDHSPKLFFGVFEYNIATLNSLILPVLFAVLAGRITDLESKENTYRLLLIRIEPKVLYRLKTCTMLIFSTLVALLQILFISIYEKVMNNSILYPHWEIWHFLNVFLVTSALALFNLFFCMKFENHLLALIVGLFFGFIGFLSTLFPPIVSRLFLFTYYHELSVVVPHYSNKDLTFTYRAFPILPSIIIIGACILFYIIGIREFCKREF